MAKREGTTQYWTDAQEKYYERLLAGCQDQVLRDLILTVRDLVKYDQRTKQAKRAVAQGRLRLATASDEELRQLAYIETITSKPLDFSKQPERFQRWKELRDRIREKGISRGELRA